VKNYWVGETAVFFLSFSFCARLLLLTKSSCWDPSTLNGRKNRCCCRPFPAPLSPPSPMTSTLFVRTTHACTRRTRACACIT